MTPGVNGCRQPQQLAARCKFSAAEGEEVVPILSAPTRVRLLRGAVAAVDDMDVVIEFGEFFDRSA